MEKVPEIIHESWHEYLQPLFNDPKMIKLKTTVLPKCKWYPSRENVFNVFKMPIDKIRVVILGQDPYHNGSANGYAFAVNKETQTPASLRVIREEITTSKVELAPGFDTAGWRTLQGWRQQGVFLLNTALTVPVGDPGAHAGMWMWFTKAVIQAISIQNKKPVWMLWGSKAQSFEGYILKTKDYSFIQKELEHVTVKELNPSEFNIVLKAPHPAAQTHPNADSRYYFVGTNQFKLCNEVLKLKGQNVINW